MTITTNFTYGSNNTDIGSTFATSLDPNFTGSINLTSNDASTFIMSTDRSSLYTTITDNNGVTRNFFGISSVKESFFIGRVAADDTKYNIILNSDILQRLGYIEVIYINRKNNIASHTYFYYNFVYGETTCNIIVKSITNENNPPTAVGVGTATPASTGSITIKLPTMNDTCWLSIRIYAIY